MTIACDTVASALSARADHEDPGLDADDIDRHLATCAACAHFAAGTETLRRRLNAQLSSDTRPRPGGADLSGRILGSIPEGPAPRGRFSNGRALSAPGVALVAAVTLVVLISAFFGGRALAGGSGGNGGNGVASVAQVAGSNQASATYPGATVLPASYSDSYSKPTVTLTDTAGQPYNIATATAGRITLLYFGYTHCPDVCPINMSLAEQALAAMPAAEQAQVTVVFITTDPHRDTPAVIRAWLNHFSTSFVGLTGTITQVQEAEHQAGLPPSAMAPADQGDGYSITHAGYTLAYSQDNRAHLQLDVTEAVGQYATTLEHLVTEGFRAQ